MNRFETGWQEPPSQGLPVPITVEARRGGRPAAPPVAAPLAAQLIAARLGLPQSRRLRRASPDAAEAAYAEAGALNQSRLPRQSRSA